MAKIAFDLLSIPAISSECEQVFSQAKLLSNIMDGGFFTDVPFLHVTRANPPTQFFQTTTQQHLYQPIKYTLFDRFTNG
jgi:hypothetical protein